MTGYKSKTARSLITSLNDKKLDIAFFYYAAIMQRLDSLIQSKKNIVVSLRVISFFR